MPAEARDRVTAIVAGLSGERPPAKAALDALLPDLYGELRRMAQWRMGGAPGQTLQATGLVHEAYLKLVDQSQVDWRGRSHFMAVAAKVMRNILVDHARERGAKKRGGDWQRVTLSLDPAAGPDLDADRLMGLNQALERLAAHDQRQARVVELRYFGGLKVDEVAVALGVSKRTVEGYWTHAQAWLRRELSGGAP